MKPPVLDRLRPPWRVPWARSNPWPETPGQLSPARPSSNPDAGHAAHRRARTWEVVEPFIAPVARAVRDRLPALPPDALVVDLGCGLGETGLTVKAAHPRARILGIDSAEGMVQAARARASRDHRTGVDFAVMDMRQLDIGSGSVDALVSRFGFLNLDDTAAEAARILRPGAPFAFAVWDRLEYHPLLDVVVAAVKRHAGPAEFEVLDRLDDLASGDTRESWLAAAGLTSVQNLLFRWPVHLADPNAVIGLVDGAPPLASAVAGLDHETRAIVTREVLHGFSAYRKGDGYEVPEACRLYWGVR